MNTIIYRDVIDKTSWGDGPWQQEPDKLQWQDETGLPCLAVRHLRTGNWCGYVGVAHGHPLYGCHYTDAEVELLPAHGGITFSDHCQEGPDEHAICHIPSPGESDDVWWFGFDCAHFMDFMPGMSADMKDLGRHAVKHGIEPPDKREDLLFWPTYKTLAYVQACCHQLAEALVWTRAT